MPRETEEPTPDERPLWGPRQADLDRYGSPDYESHGSGRGGSGSSFWKYVAAGVVLLLAASLLLNVLAPVLFSARGQRDRPPIRIEAVVTGIIDARTIKVEINGVPRTVRYIGVDAPAIREPFYDTAMAASRQWIGGATVLLEADAVDADREGRLLRYVWLDDAMVNLALVGSGLAKAARGSENVRYQSAFAQVEGNARAQDLGLWALEPGAGAALRPSPSLLSLLAPA